MKKEFVVIKIPKNNFKILLETFNGLYANIYSWNFDRFLSRRLLDDLKIMKSILEEGK